MIQYSFSEFKPTWSYASVIEDLSQLEVEHTHDYYELTVVQRGSCMHYVNGMEIPIQVGDFCLIRPSDTHYYACFASQFSLINVIVPTDVMSSMFDFLGDGFEPDRLLSTAAPPLTHLSMQNFVSICESFRSLIMYHDLLGAKADAFFHMTLINMITTYFPITLVHNRTKVPLWMQFMVQEMSKQNNYVEGITAMPLISGKSPEHICRSCKKYLGISPTQLVNHLRLNEAAHLLLESEMSIIDIAIEVGFDTLSHFYHSFASLYQTTPKQFREHGSADEIFKYSITSVMFKELPKATPARKK